MKSKIPFVAIFALLFWGCYTISSHSTSEGILVNNLHCEAMNDPLGIDVVRPRLSWALESNQRGQKQTAYHLLVASSLEKLDKNIGDLWDSGKITSEQSQNPPLPRDCIAWFCLF